MAYLLSSFRQHIVLGEVAKARELTFEGQFDGSDRAVTLLSNDDFGLARDLAHLGHLVGKFRRSLVRFVSFHIIFLSEHEHHDVGVLFDRARFTQV